MFGITVGIFWTTKDTISIKNVLQFFYERRQFSCTSEDLIIADGISRRVGGGGGGGVK